MRGLNRDERPGALPRVAGILGIIFALALTVVIWFQVIDRQATALLLGEELITGIETSLDSPGAYGATDELDAPRPIP